MNTTDHDTDVLDSLKARFGQDLGKRLYACAVIMYDNRAYSDNPLEDIEAGVRYTIGTIKHMRQRAVHSLTWAMAIDRLEEEQSEGRKYSVGGALHRDIARIEGVNRSTKKDYKAIIDNTVMRALEAEADRYASATEEQAEVRDMVTHYLAGLPKAHKVWVKELVSIGADEYDAKQRARASRVTPSNMKPVDFIELVRRYA